jgi:gliding motility-associated protein GldM
MAGNKLSPRQKMIGMMYLVLTAMLALNVSKEVLDAFQKINGGIVKTTQNFSNKNNEVYDAFLRAAETNEAKAGPWRDKAFSVKTQADELVVMMQRLKFDMVMKADGIVKLDGEFADTHTESEPEYLEFSEVIFDDLSAVQKSKAIVEITQKENRDVAGESMVNLGLGKELQANLENYRDHLISLVGDPAIQTSIEGVFSFQDRKEKYGTGMQSWVQQNFQDMPLVAAVTIISKVQADVRNAEADVIKFLQQEIDAGSLKFTSADAIQIAPSNYIFLGDSFKADVFIAAKDTTQNPMIYVGDYELDADGHYQMKGDDYLTIPVKEGKGKFAVKTRTEGHKKWGGLIAMKTDAGTKMYPFSGEYQVAKQSLVVSPTKMNVFYILGDKEGNPVDVSVPGVPKDKLYVSCNNGKILKKGGAWEVFPTKVGKAKVTVSAEINGKRRNMGAMEFRVKRVPDPVPSLPGLKNGKIKKNLLTAGSTKLRAQMKDFDFDLKFNITGFSLAGTYKGNYVEKKARGARLTAEMKELVKDLPKGSTVILSNIIAKGPDGKTRNLGAMAIKLN